MMHEAAGVIAYAGHVQVHLLLGDAGTIHAPDGSFCFSDHLRKLAESQRTTGDASMRINVGCQHIVSSTCENDPLLVYQRHVDPRTSLFIAPPSSHPSQNTSNHQQP
jgi:hypothetical protein